MTNKYDRMRQEFEADLRTMFESKLAAGLRAIADLERAVGDIQHASPPAPPTPPQEVDLRSASWADAIDAVLSSALKPMTVKEIVGVLQKSGRAFPAKTKAPVAVSVILLRKSGEMRWQANGKRPQRWRKRKEAEGV